jgi:TolB-like protein
MRAATEAPTVKPAAVGICVLPFSNMSGDAEQKHFSDGNSEDVITDLSKVSALSVIARNTAFAFEGKHVDVPQRAGQLKVSHVLEKDTAETVKWAKVDPDLDAIREHPRFKAMLAKADPRLSAEQ